jgi:hypothetical protein
MNEQEEKKLWEEATEKYNIESKLVMQRWMEETDQTTDGNDDDICFNF